MVKLVAVLSLLAVLRQKLAHPYVTAPMHAPNHHRSYATPVFQSAQDTVGIDCQIFLKRLEVSLSQWASL